jgi:FMN phosphatase YigB (HAD superfamily)
VGETLPPSPQRRSRPRHGAAMSRRERERVEEEREWKRLDERRERVEEEREWKRLDERRESGRGERVEETR